MVTKSTTGKKQSKVKVGKLKVKKESIRDLTPGEIKKVRGGDAGDHFLTKKGY